MKLYTDKEFEDAKSRQELPIKCNSCGCEFSKTKHQIQISLRVRGFVPKYCSLKCTGAVNSTCQTQPCPNCNTEFKGSTVTQKFCCRSCAAKFNNKSRIKPKAPKKLRVATWLNKTLADLKSGYSLNQYHAKIRSYSRTSTNSREQKCANCGYDKHVQTCHIKPIKDFPMDTTLGEVNHRDNLVLLCPNCHWELDNGRLIL